MKEVHLHESDRNAEFPPATQLPEPTRLLAIPPRSLRCYLKARGWRKTRQCGDHGHVYGRTETAAELLVPRSSGLPDYAPIDGLLTSVKVAFGPQDYGLVSQAHLKRQTVSLEGDLRREGSRWHLQNPRDLVLLADDDE